MNGTTAAAETAASAGGSHWSLVNRYKIRLLAEKAKAEIKKKRLIAVFGRPGEPKVQT